jgi:hypothetical protein
MAISGKTILRAIAVAVFLATLPGAIRRVMQSGDLYLFSQHFFEDMAARLEGPGRLRFVFQPVVALILGGRDGRKDARAGAAPFLWGLVFHHGNRSQLLRSAIASVSSLVIIAILLDLLSQFLIFREMHPAAALILGPVMIGLPYALARALTNRFWMRTDVTASARMR